MPARLALTFAACAAGHVALDGLIASPWGVPDLTLAGMMLVIVRAPRSWWAASLGAALLTAAWAVRAAPSVLGLYLGAGWGSAAIVRHWDLEDPRFEGVLVAAVSAIITLGLVGLDGAWSWGMAARFLLRVGVTVAAWAMVRPAAARWLTV